MYLHPLEPKGPYEEPWNCTKKDPYAWYIYKHGSDWAFNHERHMKMNEQLTGGTEKCLDWWYKQLAGKDPTHDSGMYMTISTKQIYIPTTTWKLKGEDLDRPDSHYYIDRATGMRCWLCSYGTDLGLGGAKKLYLKITLTNPGTDRRPYYKGSMMSRTSEQMAGIWD